VLAVRREPGVHLGERLRPQAVPAPLAVGPDLDQSRLPQHPQMLRDTGLAQLHARDEVRDGPLAPAQEIEDLPARGLHEASGDWLYDIGLPGKSGIGGGIVTVSPGKGGLGTFAPPLDRAGNSVKGRLVARFLSHRLGLDLFASTPER
jgi:Glutaminase